MNSPFNALKTEKWLTWGSQKRTGQRSSMSLIAGADSTISLRLSAKVRSICCARRDELGVLVFISSWIYLRTDSRLSSLCPSGKFGRKLISHFFGFFMCFLDGIPSGLFVPLLPPLMVTSGYPKFLILDLKFPILNFRLFFHPPAGRWTTLPKTWMLWFFARWTFKQLMELNVQRQSLCRHGKGTVFVWAPCF